MDSFAIKEEPQKANYCKLKERNKRKQQAIKEEIKLKMPHIMSLSLILTLTISLVQQQVFGVMNLPDGIENILGFVPKSSFQCERDGYFGDVDNDCRIFHLCQKQITSNGRTEWRHWTYACGNQTMFNQLTLTCAFVDEAIPCRHASQFQYLNEVIHKPREPFLTDADVTSGFSYYSNRIMSDGARARAFEDENLMAQLGGNTINSPQKTSTQSNNQHQNSLISSAQQSFNNQQQQQQDQPREDDDNNQLQFVPLQHQQFLQQTLREDKRNFFEQQAPLKQQFEARNDDNLIINHQHQFQHNNHRFQQLEFQQSPPQFSSFREQQPRQSFDQAQFRDQQTPQAQSQQPFRQQQFQHQQQPQPQIQQNQLQQPRQANSFDFAISTVHQPGAPTGQAENININNINNQLSPLSSEAPLPPAPIVTDVPTTTTTTTTPIQTTTQQTESTTQFQLSNTNSASLPEPTFTSLHLEPTFSTTPKETPTPTTTTTTTTQSAATITTTTGLVSTDKPTTSSISTPLSSITTTTTATNLPRRQVVVVRRHQQPKQQQQQQQQQQEPIKKQENFVAFDGQMRGFQSARLSSLNKVKASKPEESSIVMRRQLQSVTTASSSLPTGTLSAGPLAASSEAGQSNFWRRTLEAPRFESLINRRRV